MDNDSVTMKFVRGAWIFNLISDEGLEPRIIDNFKEFTGSRIEPMFNLNDGTINFAIHTGDEADNIKISRGEESIFIWSIFYTI